MKCRDLTKQALGKHAGEPAKGGFARWKHVVLHCFRLEEGHSYRETPNRLKHMTVICDTLGLYPEDLPDFTTLYKSFNRLEMWSGGRCCAFQRSNIRSPATLHSTVHSSTAAQLVVLPPAVGKSRPNAESDDTNRQRVSCCPRCTYFRPTETRYEDRLQVVRRNADDLLSVATDKVLHNWSTKYEFYALGVEPLILQRGSRPLTRGHNAFIRAKGYSQRWMTETSYSTTKRSLGDAVRALGWYRQFREIVLMFTISNIEPLCEPL